MGDNQDHLPARRGRVFSRLVKLCEGGNCPLSPFPMLCLGLFTAAAGGVAIWFSTGRAGLAVLDAVIFFAVPWVWVGLRSRARLRRFDGQLPDALELIARALRAGHSLAAGLHVVAEEMPPPTATEFARAYDEQNLGVPLNEALDAMLGRVGSSDLRLFVVAVGLQQNTGGDLAVILDGISSLARARQCTLGYAARLNTSLRLNAIIFSALPLAALLLTLHVREDAIIRLWEPTDGVRPGLVALAAWGVGTLWLAKQITTRD